RPTARGRREIRELNDRSDRLAARLLGAISPKQRERLVAAMAEVHRVLRAAGLVIQRVDPARPGGRWCVAQYFAELGRRFPAGFGHVAPFNADPYATHWFEKRLGRTRTSRARARGTASA